MLGGVRELAIADSTIGQPLDADPRPAPCTQILSSCLGTSLTMSVLALFLRAYALVRSPACLQPWFACCARSLPVGCAAHEGTQALALKCKCSCKAGRAGSHTSGGSRAPSPRSCSTPPPPLQANAPNVLGTDEALLAEFVRIPTGLGSWTNAGVLVGAATVVSLLRFTLLSSWPDFR